MKCDQKCDVFSRPIGYYTPVDNWNPGKQAEFRDRVPFSADKALKRIADEADAAEAKNSA